MCVFKTNILNQDGNFPQELPENKVFSDLVNVVLKTYTLFKTHIHEHTETHTYKFHVTKNNDKHYSYLGLSL